MRENHVGAERHLRVERRSGGFDRPIRERYQRGGKRRRPDVDGHAEQRPASPRPGGNQFAPMDRRGHRRRGGVGRRQVRQDGRGGHQRSLHEAGRDAQRVEDGRRRRRVEEDRRAHCPDVDERTREGVRREVRAERLPGERTGHARDLDDRRRVESQLARETPAGIELLGGERLALGFGRGRRALDDTHTTAPARALRPARLFDEDPDGGGSQVQLRDGIGLVGPVLGKETDCERFRSHRAGLYHPVVGVSMAGGPTQV